LLAPPVCASCASSTEAAEPLCDRCLERLRSTRPVVETGPPGVDLAVAASPFEGPARRVVHGLKFERRLGLARIAAESMLRALPSYVVFETVVAVPAGPWRRRWRGFDPAEEIAVAVASLAARPISDCLRRSGGRRQVGRRRAERLSNPPRVWATSSPPREALLVDDVWTTGATLSACATALRNAGCGAVTSLTLARAL
jgi:predicted amidophosphoribosyltransferase